MLQRSGLFWTLGISKCKIQTKTERVHVLTDKEAAENRACRNVIENSRGATGMLQIVEWSQRITCYALCQSRAIKTIPICVDHCKRRF